MYHCQIHFYFSGHPCRVFEGFRESSPLEHFTHSFTESLQPEATLARGADVIVANLEDTDERETVDRLVQAKRGDAELILLADSARAEVLLREKRLVKDVADLWILPMTEEEISFRVSRWQQQFKREKDFWETRHFFEATIRSEERRVGKECAA